MIQRIQTLFLLFATVLNAFLLALPLPFAESSQAVQDSALFADKQYDVFDQTALVILFGLGTLLALAAIFLFKKRPVQIQLTRFAFITTLLGMLIAVVLVLNDSALAKASEVAIDDEPGAFLPFLSLVMLWLAMRYIQKDENLVKSMDRLR